MSAALAASMRRPEPFYREAVVDSGSRLTSRPAI